MLPNVARNVADWFIILAMNLAERLAGLKTTRRRVAIGAGAAALAGAEACALGYQVDYNVNNGLEISYKSPCIMDRRVTWSRFFFPPTRPDFPGSERRVTVLSSTGQEACGTTFVQPVGTPVPPEPQGGSQ